MNESHLRAVRFHFLILFNLPKRKKIKETVRLLFEREKFKLNSLDFIFCNDAYLLKINQKYLNHSELTDIITFDLSDKKGEVTGEIYISIDRVKENANTYKFSFQAELTRVMFHGCLHLCGYKDKSVPAKKLMRLKEDEYLNRFIQP